MIVLWDTEGAGAQVDAVPFLPANKNVAIFLMEQTNGKDGPGVAFEAVNETDPGRTQPTAEEG